MRCPDFGKPMNVVGESVGFVVLGLWQLGFIEGDLEVGRGLWWGLWWGLRAGCPSHGGAC